MAKYRIVDGNSVGRAAHAATKLTAGGMQTQAIFNVIKSAREMKFMKRDFNPIFLWDGKAQFRFDLCPTYKSNRDNDPQKVVDKEAYNKQKPFIHEALSALGIKQMLVTTHEADDLAGILVGNIARTDPDYEIILTTGDMDWVQLVRKNVTWQDHRDHDKIITLDNLMDMTGFRTPYAFLEGKCLKGDSSDVIPGVGKIGEKGAPEFIAEFGSVREFWRQCDSGEFKPKKVAHVNLASEAGRAIFARNLRVMQLIKPAPIDKANMVKMEAKYDEDKFLRICERFSFLSILRDPDAFLAPFKPR